MNYYLVSPEKLELLISEVTYALALNHLKRCEAALTPKADTLKSFREKKFREDEMINVKIF